MKRCAYFNPGNLPSGGPRMKSELPHHRRKAAKARLAQTSVSRRRREEENENEILEIDSEYAEMEKLVSKLPNEAENETDITRRSDKKILEKIKNSENFFDLLELAHESRKQSIGNIH